MNNTKILWIVVVVVFGGLALFFWNSFDLGFDSSTKPIPEKEEIILDSLTAPGGTSLQALTSEQKAALRSLAAPEKPPIQTSSSEMEAILKSLEAR